MNEPKPHESLSRGGDVVGLGAARGKAGRANTATDPAPTEMFETVINLRPEAEWRAGMTTNKLIAELDQALQFTGVANAWTMPIKARIDMLSSGIRTPIGIILETTVSRLHSQNSPATDALVGPRCRREFA